MKRILKLELTGENDALHNVVGIIMRNEKVEIQSLRYETPAPLVVNTGVSRSSRQPNRDPRLVYDMVGGKKKININQSLANLGLTRDTIKANVWTCGSAEHSVRRAISMEEKHQ